jgi:hypothetical protein
VDGGCNPADAGGSVAIVCSTAPLIGSGESMDVSSVVFALVFFETLDIKQNLNWLGDWNFYFR